MKKTNFTPFCHPNCLQGGLKETSTNVMLFLQRKDKTLLFIAEEGLEKPGQKCIFFNKMIIYCLFSLQFQSVSVDFRQSSTSSHNVTKGRRSLLCFLVCGL
jgi:hypothetical protein